MKKCKSNQERRESNRGGIDQNPDYGLQLFLENMRKYSFLSQNIARIANAVQVTICLLVSTNVY